MEKESRTRYKIRYTPGTNKRLAISTLADRNRVGDLGAV